MNGPHKHEKLIKAWANGFKIQALNNETNEWEECDNPDWNPNTQFRIDSNEPEKPKGGQSYLYFEIAIKRSEWSEREIDLARLRDRNCFIEDSYACLTIEDTERKLNAEIKRILSETEASNGNA